MQRVHEIWAKLVLLEWDCPFYANFLKMRVSVCLYSRDQVEGADSDCQRTPWKTREGVQPHQLGAQPSGQETEKGTRSQESLSKIFSNL